MQSTHDIEKLAPPVGVTDSKDEDSVNKNATSTYLDLLDTSSREGRRRARAEKERKWSWLMYVRIPWWNYREWFSRVRYVWWWVFGTLILAVPLALTATKFRTSHIKDVHLLGLFFWMELSWLALWASYFISWGLGEIWYHLTQFGRLSIDDYEIFLRDLRFPVMLLLWSIMSWAMVPLMCHYDHSHCTGDWVSVFQKVLLATLVVSIMWFVKGLFVELLYIKTAIEVMNKKQTVLEDGVYAIYLLARSAEKTSRDWRTWQDKMKHWIKMLFIIPDPQDYFYRHHQRVEGFIEAVFYGYGDTVVYDDFPESREIVIYDALIERIRRNFKITDSKPLYKTEVVDHLDDLEYIQSKTVSEGLSRFGFNPVAKVRADRIWQLFNISEGNIDDFELSWLVYDTAEGLSEVIEGQQHLRKAVGDLNIILFFVFFVAAALVYAAFFVKNPGNYLTPLWTTFTGVSFALQGTVQEFVSACVFVFAQHPYDVNDWVLLSGTDEHKHKLKVTNIRLMSTIFSYPNDVNEVIIPHNKLSKERIENLSRWKYATKDLIEKVPLKPGMSEEHVPKLQEDLEDFVRKSRKPPIRRFYQTVSIDLVPTKDNDLKKQVEVKFSRKAMISGAFDEEAEKCRDAVLREVRKLLRGRGVLEEKLEPILQTNLKSTPDPPRGTSNEDQGKTNDNTSKNGATAGAPEPPTGTS